MKNRSNKTAKCISGHQIDFEEFRSNSYVELCLCNIEYCVLEKQQCRADLEDSSIIPANDLKTEPSI